MLDGLVYVREASTDKLVRFINILSQGFIQSILINHPRLTTLGFACPRRPQVASSVDNRNSYYDTRAEDRIVTTSSPDALIAWSAERLKARVVGGDIWPSDTTIVEWVNEPFTYAGGSRVERGEAFYIQTQDFEQPGIKWQIVVVERVSCASGSEVDTEKYVCKKCVPPTTSLGGAELCDRCVEGFFWSVDQCLECPSGAVCEGNGMMPYPKVGYWAPLDKVDMDATPCISGGNCPGGDASADARDCKFVPPPTHLETGPSLLT